GVFQRGSWDRPHPAAHLRSPTRRPPAAQRMFCKRPLSAKVLTHSSGHAANSAGLAAGHSGFAQPAVAKIATWEPKLAENRLAPVSEMLRSRGGQRRRRGGGEAGEKRGEGGLRSQALQGLPLASGCASHVGAPSAGLRPRASSGAGRQRAAGGSAKKQGSGVALARERTTAEPPRRALYSGGPR
ncbi:unnamed protein product, partial [Prorocentrum cordatum]